MLPKKQSVKTGKGDYYFKSNKAEREVKMVQKYGDLRLSSSLRQRQVNVKSFRTPRDHSED